MVLPWQNCPIGFSASADVEIVEKEAEEGAEASIRQSKMIVGIFFQYLESNRNPTQEAAAICIITAIAIIMLLDCRNPCL